MENALISDVCVFEGTMYTDEPKSRPGVLRTVRGPIAEWDKKNRNGRVYSEKLWDRVLESPYVKEQVKHKTLLGEGNHPSERFEVEYSRVSHAISEMYKVPEKKQVWAVIDILDTPLGNILNTLYEYGSVLGYSTRAGGKLVKRKDYTEVDENTYHFITVDSVPFPSVEIARPVMEGVETNPNDRFELSEEVHRELEKIIEESSKKDRDLLRSFIYELREYNLDREIGKLDSYLEEGTETKVSEEISLESEDKGTIKDTTLYLLKESYMLSSTLREENTKLEEKISELESRGNTLESLLESNESLQKDKLVLESRVTEVEGDSKKLRDTISEMEENLSDVEYLQEEITMYKGEISEKDNVIKILKNENKKLVDQVQALNESLENLKTVSEETEEETVEKVEESVSTEPTEQDLEFVRLTSELSETAIELGAVIKESHEWQGKYETLLENVEEKNSSIQSLLEEKDTSIQSLVEKTEVLSGEVKQLQESVSTLESKNLGLGEKLARYKSSVREYQSSLVETVCSSYKLSTDEVMGKLGEDFDMSDIHLVCEELSNSRSSFIAEVTDTGKTSDKNNRLHDVYSTGGRRRG